MSNLTIEPYIDTLFHGVAVYRHDVYPDSSVLAGQDRRAFVEMFETVEDALVVGHSTRRHSAGDSLADLSGLPSEPPSWFDPAAAGERWDDD